MKYLSILLFLSTLHASAQTEKKYIDSLRAFQQNYVNTHEVVKGTDKKFLRFFPVNASFRVEALFEKVSDSLRMKNSKGGKETFYRYGKISFKLNKTVYHMYIYQSPRLMNTADYKSYLFLPFTDLTSGHETYGGGRYIDLSATDIGNNKLVIDFNKAYNPYCAYGPGYRCPIPPKENDLPVSIVAGEKAYGKAVH